MKTAKRILIAIPVIVVVFILGLLALIYIPSLKFEPVKYKPVKPAYWPTEKFRTSTPEEQGMDSRLLVEMISNLKEKQSMDKTVSIESMTIVRNGYIVVELYFNPLYPPDTMHIIHSCTKSLMSALIGIAIDSGHIKDVNVPLVDFFPDKAAAVRDDRIKKVTLKDLLTMQTGIRSRDSYLYKYQGLFETMATDDWVAHILSLPVDVKPGSRFDYSNLSSFLLSAIIKKTTGMDTLLFAKKYLFTPLGISDVQWETSPKGIGIGFARMWLKPHDMAKIGLLYLQKGKWGDRQIIPEKWIHDSITPHGYPKNYVDILDKDGKKDTEASQKNWVGFKFFKPFSDGYGYQWWLDKSGSYNALGTSGQFITVFPEQNLVIAVTSSSRGMGTFFPVTLMKDFIIPSVISDKAITANDKAGQELAEYSYPPEPDKEMRIDSATPGIAAEISGRTYALNKNRWKYNNFRVDFKPGRDFAMFSFTAKVHDKASFKVGLDGIKRFTDTDIGTFAATGTWLNEKTLQISYQQIGYSAPGKFILTFDKDTIKVKEASLTGTYIYSGTVK